MIVALLLACTGKGEDSDAALDPTPYIYEDTDPPEAARTAEEVEVAVDVALLAAIDVDASPVFHAYDSAMVGQSSGCPDFYADEGNTYWFDDCTTEEGAYFRGYGYTVAYDAYLDPYSGYTFNGRALYASATVSAMDGSTFEGAGTVQSLVGDQGADHYASDYVAGTFGWDGEGIEGTWLAEGVSPSIDLERYWNDDYDGHYALLTGGLAPLVDGGDFVAVSIDDLNWMDENLGNTCPEEPGGSISVRDADGGWYDVVFDGSTEVEVDASVCDGCGTVFFEGEPIGQACPDFGPFFAKGGGE